jgi:mannose-6-phosphate isomerase-like protein (cupin superfamily)
VAYSRSTALGRIDGVGEAAILGPANAAEGTSAGKMAWKHGFHVRRLRLQPGARIPMHVRSEEEVIFVHRGSLQVTVGSDTRVLQAGDLITTPIGAERALANPGTEVCDLIVVRGGNSPAAPQWCRQAQA